MKSILYVLPFLCLVGCSESAKIARSDDEKTERQLKKLAEEPMKSLAEEPLKKLENVDPLPSLTAKDKADLERARESIRLGEKGIVGEPLTQRQIELLNKYGAKSTPPPPPNPGNIQIGEAWGPVSDESKAPQSPYGILAPGTKIIDQSKAQETLDRVTKNRDGTVTITRVFPPLDTRSIEDFIRKQHADLKGKLFWSEKDKRHMAQFCVPVEEHRVIIVTFEFHAEMGMMMPHGPMPEIPFTDGILVFIGEQHKK